jgi:hypothetical protein
VRRRCGLLLLHLGILDRFVMTNGAASHSTKHRMVTCNMAGHATDCCA